MTMLAPAEIAGACAGASAKKADLTFGKTMILGLLAGVYIGFGANLATMIGCDASTYVGNGIGQLLFGGVFAVGLMLVVIGGSELFTGNNMFMVVGALDGTHRLGRPGQELDPGLDSQLYWLGSPGLYNRVWFLLAASQWACLKEPWRPKPWQ